MPTPSSVLSADSTIAAWLQHPIGARIIAGIAAQGSLDDAAVQRMRNIPLARFIAAGGPPPEGLLDSLV